jgi:hypothetical protein
MIATDLALLDSIYEIVFKVFFLLIKCNRNYSHYFSPIWKSVWDQSYMHHMGVMQKMSFNPKVCVVRNIKYVFIPNFQISNLNLLQFITWLINHFDNILILLVFKGVFNETYVLLPMSSIWDDLQMVKVVLLILLTLNEGIDQIFNFYIWIYSRPLTICN